MPVFLNPFQKHDVRDFPDVYVPLGQSTRHPSIVAEHDEKIAAHKDGEKVDDENPPAYDYSANTMEGLRAEIDLDIAASGHDTAYDRT